MFPVLRILDVYPGSRILIFTHPGSRIQKQLQKKGVKKISLLEKPPSVCICSPSRASSRTRLLRSLHANAGVPLTLLSFAQLAKRKV
jgi:hypothetical protein